jgi:hypothetical protein
LDEFQTCHLFLSVGGDGSVGFADDTARHPTLSAEQGAFGHPIGCTGLSLAGFGLHPRERSSELAFAWLR